MAKIYQQGQTTKKIRTPQKSEVSTSYNLDTLERRRTSTIDGGYRATKQTFQKRAKRKSIARVLTSKLINLDSPLQKAYKLTHSFCANELLHNGNEITSRYCGYRWCPVCNPIRTAKLINGYLPVFAEFKDPYLVTLTAPTCTKEQLAETVEHRGQVWASILNHSRTLYNRGKINYRLKGIRKLEITARPDGMFNPHFHIIVEGKESANLIKAQWLHRYPDADRKLQKVDKANPDSLKELFKYITKFWTEDKETGKPVIYSPEQMDAIFQALQGKPTARPFGGVKMVRDEVEQIETIQVKDMTEKYDISVWNQAVMDWIDTYGECASGYTPTDKDRQFLTEIEQSKEQDKTTIKQR